MALTRGVPGGVPAPHLSGEGVLQASRRTWSGTEGAAPPTPALPLAHSAGRPYAPNGGPAVRSSRAAAWRPAPCSGQGQAGSGTFQARAAVPSEDIAGSCRRQRSPASPEDRRAPVGHPWRLLAPGPQDQVVVVDTRRRPTGNSRPPM
ncbi:hypothetical protein VULLAG_LOCUS17713 [Vulpes lagopus]